MRQGRVTILLVRLLVRPGNDAQYHGQARLGIY